MPFLKILGVAAVSVGLLLAGFFSHSIAPQTVSSPTVGSFYPVGGQTYVLSGAGVSSSATTINLTSFQTPDGRPLTMSMFGSIGYGVIDPNSPTKIEDVTFTGITQNANGTAVLTGVTRGHDFVTPYLSSTTLSLSHAGGAYFILSNTAGFYGQQFLFSDTLGTSTGGIVFSSTTVPHYDFSPAGHSSGTYYSTTTEFVDFVALNAVTTAGAPNATAVVKGIVQLGTALQAASSTLLGSTGASLAISTSIATDTPQRGCAVGYTATAGAGCTIIADLTGKIKQAWIDLTQSFAFSKISATEATTTTSLYTTLGKFGGNGIYYLLPSVQGASSTALLNDGSGNLTWQQPQSRVLAALPYSNAVITGTTATTSLITVAIPANTLTATAGQLTASVTFADDGINLGCAFEELIGTGSATTSIGSASSGGYIFNSTLVASSTSRATMIVYNPSLVIQAPSSKTTTSTTVGNTNQMYISFSARPLNSADKCRVMSYLVQVLTP